MKFAILIYTDRTLLDALPAGQFDAKMRHCLAHADELRQDGRLLDSQMLEGAATAKSVRVRGSRRTVVDGPFTETKEMLGVPVGGDGVRRGARGPGHRGRAAARQRLSRVTLSVPPVSRRR